MKLSERQRDFLKVARIKKDLTIQQLADNAHLVVNTIRAIESGSKSSFTEQTIRLVCRALEIDFLDLLRLDTPPNTKGPLKKLVTFGRRVPKTVLLGLIFLLIIYFIPKSSNQKYLRTDYILPKHRNAFYYDRPDSKPDGKKVQALVNYVEIKQFVHPKEEILVRIKWSWNYPPEGRPYVYVSTYTEWEPNQEIPIFDGIITGEGSDVQQFKIVAPKQIGRHKIRFFYASAYGPVPSFYGGPPSSMMESPSSAPYLEMEIEVLPEGEDTSN